MGKGKERAARVRKPVAVSPPTNTPQKLFDITEGTVIDHIPAGQALRVLKVLGIQEYTDRLISVGMNLSSRKLGRKDIVKVEGKLLSKDELSKLALIGPGATINHISRGAVKGKFKVTLPDMLIGTICCPNPNCITRNQPVPGKLSVVQRKPIILSCTYCERMVEENQIELS